MSTAPENDENSVANIFDLLKNCPNAFAMFQKSQNGGKPLVGARKRKATQPIPIPTGITATATATVSPVPKPGTIVISTSATKGVTIRVVGNEGHGSTGATGDVVVLNSAGITIKSKRLREFEQAFREIYGKMKENRKDQGTLGTVKCVFCEKDQKLFTCAKNSRLQFLIDHVFFHAPDKFRCKLCDYEIGVPYALKLHAIKKHNHVKSVIEYVADHGITLENMMNSMYNTYANDIQRDPPPIAAVEDVGNSSAISYPSYEEPLPYQPLLPPKDDAIDRPRVLEAESLDSSDDSYEGPLTEKESNIFEDWITEQSIDNFARADEAYCHLCQENVYVEEDCSGLMRHAIQHAYTVRFSCKICNGGFRERGAIEAHIGATHEDMTIDDFDDVIFDQMDGNEEDLKTVLTDCFIDQGGEEDSENLSNMESVNGYEHEYARVLRRAALDKQYSSDSDGEVKCLAEGKRARMPATSYGYREITNTTANGTETIFRCPACQFSTKMEPMIINHCISMHSV